ncbi:kinase-like protein [Auricularia subglabra TFB-10046 SS5]|nr:kinase-like protein [Auricularia subglabra TFB-10046 SS5]
MACVLDDPQPGQVVLTSTKPSTQATAIVKNENPIAILLWVATILQFLHSTTDTKMIALVHGNLNLGSSIAASIQSPHSRRACGATRMPPDGHRPSMAPELISHEIRTTKTDVYAFGMLVFRMFSGKYPFDEFRPRDEHRVSAMARLGGGKRPAREEILHPDFSDELWELMTECWRQEPSDRPTMAAVRVRLAQMVEDRASHPRGGHARLATT